MCGCGANAVVPQVSITPAQYIDQSTPATSGSSECEFTTQSLLDWKTKLDSIPAQERVNYNIYMGYINSGLADSRLICGALFPMLKVISTYISSLQ